MTRDAYLRHLERLALTQVEGGAFFGKSARTAARWAADGPPVEIAMLLLEAKNRKHLEQLRTRARRAGGRS